MGPGLVVVEDPIVGVGAKASDGAVGCGGEADSVQAARAKTEAAIRANLGVTPCVCSPSRAYQRRPRYRAPRLDPQSVLLFGCPPF